MIRLLSIGVAATLTIAGMLAPVAAKLVAKHRLVQDVQHGGIFGRLSTTGSTRGHFPAWPKHQRVSANLTLSAHA